MINMRNARAFCSEDISKIENYQEAISDETQVWDIHHRRETDEGISKRELLRRKEYFHRPSGELIFLTRREHKRLHWVNLPEETRRKISQARLGTKSFLGKHHSLESRKRMSKAQLGMRWWTNGVKTVRAKICPPGFHPGRI